MSNNKFSEEEIAKIIRRASELEAGLEKKKQISDKGLSLDELTELASELGINPDSIREAAQELMPVEDVLSGHKSEVSGEIIYSEKVIDFIPEGEALDTILNELNHNYKSSTFHLFWGAKNKRKGNRLEWSNMDSSGSYETSVLMQPFGDKYKIRVTRKSLWGMSYNSEIYFYLFFIALFGGGALTAGAFFISELWLGVVLTAILLSICYPVVKKYNKRMIQRYIDGCDDLLKEIISNLSILNSTEPKKERKINLDTIPEKPLWEEHEPGPLRNQLRNK